MSKTPEGFDEDQPHARLEMNGSDEVIMWPGNGTLFTFVGKTALSDGIEVDSDNLNHVFVAYERDEDDSVFGTYIFSHNQAYAALSKYMFENGFPVHLNLRQVAQCDIDAYEGALQKEFGDLDSFPDEWLK